MTQRAHNEELERDWMPRLVRAWRRLSGESGPENDLSQAEVERVGAAVRALSSGLIKDRALIGRSYMQDASHLGAYLLYFWPTSYVQARHVLKHLPVEAIRRGPALDLGSGPGPMALAASDLGAPQVTLWESSERALEVALALGREANRVLQGERLDLHDVRALEPGRYALIMAGHALNELWSADGEEEALSKRAQLCEQLLSALSSGGHLVLIEPALRETSRALLSVRDRLIERGHQVEAPCYFKGACPALERERDWCHAELSWTPPPLVARIARAAGRRRERVKMTYVIFTRSLQTAAVVSHPDTVFRLVSEPLHQKGRFEFIGCGPAGRAKLALLKRDRDAALKASFIKRERWEVLDVQGAERRPDGELRLSKRSTASIYSGPFEPL